MDHVVRRHVTLRIKVVAFRVPVLSSLVICISIVPSLFGLYLLPLNLVSNAGMVIEAQPHIQ